MRHTSVILARVSSRRFKEVLIEKNAVGDPRADEREGTIKIGEGSHDGVKPEQHGGRWTFDSVSLEEASYGHCGAPIE